MQTYSGIWRTKHVRIEMRVEGDDVVIQRIRGQKQKRKKLNIKIKYFKCLVEAVLNATTQQPHYTLVNRTVVGMLEGGCGLVTLEWAPYWYGRCNALMIRGLVGQCISVEQQDVLNFALWLAGQQLQIQAVAELNATNQ